MKRLHPHASGGFGAIAAIFVLVVLASLAAAIVRLGQSTQTGSAQDILGARAWAAARAGTEWGLYQALKGSWTTCSGASQTLDLRADIGMRVTVSCSSTLYNEGENTSGAAQTLRVYTVNAVACNSTSACPDNARAVQPGYIERRRQVQAAQ
ncbi:MSHA biogenesis protein MshP [uncultured Sphaerotilus sp.]|uniref:MSHA biogenesis protein MshP n=1 Tax=uncultured Sphaerotilus sp. TaxID=474984 RepID=UPI0030CA280E